MRAEDANNTIVDILNEPERSCSSNYVLGITGFDMSPPIFCAKSFWSLSTTPSLRYSGSSVSKLQNWQIRGSSQGFDQLRILASPIDDCQAQAKPTIAILFFDHHLVLTLLAWACRQRGDFASQLGVEALSRQDSLSRNRCR